MPNQDDHVAIDGLFDRIEDVARNSQPRDRDAETQIQQRICYAESAGDGLSVVEMKQTSPSHKQAAEEIRALVEELVSFANG